MEWQARRGTDILERIVALLFVLAGLAENAAAAPRTVRCRMLAVLYRAEIVAHASFCGVACDFGAPAMPQAAGFAALPDGDSPSDAALLALRLRALALVWIGLLAWLQKVVRRQTRGGLDALGAALVRKVDVARLLPVPAFARPPIDTS